MSLDATTTERPDGWDADGAADSDSFSQYVTFHLGDECFAFPMASVLEIIRVPATVGVPLTPKGLVGLANLRGTVLPVVDLRRTLGLGDRAYDDATRVIVVDCGRPVGLVVDRVARVLNVGPDRIEASDKVQSIVDVALLTGVVKNVDGHDLIQLVDAERVVELEFATIAGEACGQSAAGGGLPVGDSTADADGGEDDTMQLVSVVVDAQEYAFEICEVDEIVRVPEKISHVPHADGHVLGLINLRNRLLPLVSLRRIFSLAEVELDENHRVIVVRLGNGGGDHERVGIVVDQVREVLRVSSQIKDQMPRILARGGDADQISAVCRLEGGKRLVCILSAGALFDHPALRQAIAVGRAHEAAVGEADAADAADAQMEAEAMDETDETQLVVYQLARQEYGVDIQSVQEIIRVPEALNRVPKTPEFVEGMINLRGTVLPVVEMRLRFGVARLDRNDRQRILVLNVAGVRTGFIVDQVSEVLRVPRAAVERAPKLSEEQDRMIGEVANLNDGKRMVLVLDAEALLQADERAALDPAGTAPAATAAPVAKRRRLRPTAVRKAVDGEEAGAAG